ncbi:MAG: phosphate ABC transporter permease PstA [Pseudomonadota bacterium]
MTDAPVSPARPAAAETSASVAARLKRRRQAERRFQLYGLAAIGVAISMLLVLVISIMTLAVTAFTHHQVRFDLPLRADVVAPEGTDDPELIAENVSGFYQLIREDLGQTFPAAAGSVGLTRQLNGLVTRLATIPIARSTADAPERIGTVQTYYAALSDDLDLYLKGRATGETVMDAGEIAAAIPGEGRRLTLTLKRSDAALADRIVAHRGSVLLQDGAAIARVSSANAATFTGELLTGEADAFVGTRPGIRFITLPEAERNVTDRQIAWVRALDEQGRLTRRLNTSLLSNADSTYPEIAGVLAAIVGSMLTMLVTASFAVPVGIAAALYLEEFAPRNRITELIEVNINNLAAVPSIVFGLLGAAVFINLFGMPRSVPVVGGLVLGLLTMPTVIIASRAALRAVPPSIRTAALGLGASRTQTVFHHVLPLAAPGILTGAIIGLARALGETAPLLLIGMVAFVAEVPSGPTDEATALPVLVYKWSTGAERAWEYNTAAAIIVLLVFMIVMNAAAVLLRRRFERRW